jgi:hypothetical protein
VTSELEPIDLPNQNDPFARTARSSRSAEDLVHRIESKRGMKLHAPEPEISNNVPTTYFGCAGKFY